METQAYTVIENLIKCSSMADGQNQGDLASRALRVAKSMHAEKARYREIETLADNLKEHGFNKEAEDLLKSAQWWKPKSRGQKTLQKTRREDRKQERTDRKNEMSRQMRRVKQAEDAIQKLDGYYDAIGDMDEFINDINRHFDIDAHIARVRPSMISLQEEISGLSNSFQGALESMQSNQFTWTPDSNPSAPPGGDVQEEVAPIEEVQPQAQPAAPTSPAIEDDASDWGQILNPGAQPARRNAPSGGAQPPPVPQQRGKPVPAVPAQGNFPTELNRNLPMPSLEPGQTGPKKFNRKRPAPRVEGPSKQQNLKLQPKNYWDALN